MDYSAKNWYWIVGGDESRVYSSAIGGYLPADDAGYLAWLAGGGVATRILNEDELAEVLANASVRPANAAILDKYKGSQADNLTMKLVAKVLFNHENRVRALEGRAAVTANQFRNALKDML